MTTLYKNSNGRMLNDKIIINKRTLYIETKFMDEILFVTAKGEYTQESAVSTFKEICDYLMKEKYIYKVLFDCRNIVNLTTNPMEIHEYSKLITGECHSRSKLPQLAYLFPSDTDMTYYKFGETVADNRGAYIKVSNNLDELLLWLKKSS